MKQPQQLQLKEEMVQYAFQALEKTALIQQILQSDASLSEKRRRKNDRIKSKFSINTYFSIIKSVNE